MPYPVLNPANRDPSRETKCALAVMAKAPRPGRVKTRLCPPLTAEQSAALNICFLRDTTENLALVAISGSACGIISYTPVGDEALFDGLLPDDFALIAQRGNGFGERLLASAEDLLGCGFGAVCLIDSDSPTAPTSCFEQAVGALAQPGDRIVLGPSQDGGYYLIGLKHAHPEPFERINWSTSTVFEETVAAAEAAGIEVVRLQLWYDVDDQATLAVLEAELLDALPPAFASPVNGSPVLASSAVSSTRGYDATHSRRFLKSLRAAACG